MTDQIKTMIDGGRHLVPLHMWALLSATLSIVFHRAASSPRCFQMIL